MDDILKKIVDVKYDEIVAAKHVRSLSSLREEAEQRQDQRGFARALQAKVSEGQAAVIAEVKKSQPQQGRVARRFPPGGHRGQL